MNVKPSAQPDGTVLEGGDKDEQILARPECPTVPPSFQLKKILVPLDFSACSQKALEYAVPFARQFNASLTLLNVVLVAYPTGEFGTLEPLLPQGEVEEASREQLQAFAAAHIGTQVPSAVLVRAGQPADEIVQAASDTGADLIIISTHGHTGLKHVLLGSVAEHVVRRAPCPVLVVREHEHDFVTPSPGTSA